MPIFAIQKYPYVFNRKYQVGMQLAITEFIESEQWALPGCSLYFARSLYRYYKKLQYTLP